MDEKYGSRFPERGLCLVLRACTPYEFPSLSPSLPPPFVQRYNNEVLLCISTNVACVQPPAFLKKKSEIGPSPIFFFSSGEQAAVHRLAQIQCRQWP